MVLAVVRVHPVLRCFELFVECPRGAWELPRAPARASAEPRGRGRDHDEATAAAAAAHEEWDLPEDPAVRVRVLGFASEAEVTPRAARRPRAVFSEGLWSSEDDWRPRGRFLPAGVPPRVAPLGIPVGGGPTLARIAAVFRALRDRAVAWDLARVPPLVAYHGTSAACVEGILREGLRETEHGMLGRGVYLADPWKAAHRYAARGPAYAARPEGGALVRVYVAARPAELRWRVARSSVHEAAEACACAVCRRRGAPWCTVADHESRWRTAGFAGAAAPADERWGPEGMRRVLRNEEFCVRGDRCHVQQVYLLEPLTPEDMAVPYDPHARHVCWGVRRRRDP